MKGFCFSSRIRVEKVGDVKGNGDGMEREREKKRGE